MRRARLASLVLLLAGCAPDAPPPTPLSPTPSLAKAPAARAATLKNTAQTVLWSGVGLRDGAPSGGIPECAAVVCDRFDLTIDLPNGAFNNKPGGVEVAVRWSGFGNNLKLYVYQAGARVAVSDGVVATAQSVLLPAAPDGAAPDGVYQVYVAYDFDMAAQFGTPLEPRVPYEALAEVEYAPKAHPTRALLPDLQSRPQRNVTFDVPPAIFFEAGVPTTNCFPSEINEEGARLCLRFDQVLANTGEGPLEFRFLLPPDPMSVPSGPIVQRVYHTDGSVTQRDGGTWVFHPTHQHFHYTGFALSRLFAVDGSGKKGATAVRARRHRVGTLGAPAAAGRKVSFCIVDIEIDAWAEKGDAPRTYSAPACLEPTPEGYLRQGLSAGWADVYDWFLPDQYLDVYGLPDGLYVLETVADPDDTILEANEQNNCGSVYVRLTGLATSSPRAALVGPGPACSP